MNLKEWLHAMAEQLIRKGYRVVPVFDDGKTLPYKKGQRYSANTCAATYLEYGDPKWLAIVLDDCVLVDYDGNKHDNILPIEEVLHLLGVDPKAKVQKNTAGDSLHYLMRLPSDAMGVLMHSADNFLEGVDIKCQNQLMHIKMTKHQRIPHIDSLLPASDDIIEALMPHELKEPVFIEEEDDLAELWEEFAGLIQYACQGAHTERQWSEVIWATETLFKDSDYWGEAYELLCTYSDESGQTVASKLGRTDGSFGMGTIKHFADLTKPAFNVKDFLSNQKLKYVQPLIEQEYHDEDDVIGKLYITQEMQDVLHSSDESLETLNAIARIEESIRANAGSHQIVKDRFGDDEMHHGVKTESAHEFSWRDDDGGFHVAWYEISNPRRPAWLTSEFFTGEMMKERPMIIKHWLSEGIVTLAAERGSGKSTFLTSVILHVIGVEPINGLDDIGEQWRHVIFRSEDPMQMEELIRATCQKIARDTHRNYGDLLALVRERFHLTETTRVLPDDAALLAAECMDYAMNGTLPPLFIFDTYAASLELESINDSSEVSRAVSALKTAKLNILLITHVAKTAAYGDTKKTALGSQSLEGDANQCMTLAGEDRDSTTRTIEFTKIRFSTKLHHMVFTIEPETLTVYDSFKNDGSTVDKLVSVPVVKAMTREQAQKELAEAQERACELAEAEKETVLKLLIANGGYFGSREPDANNPLKRVPPEYRNTLKIHQRLEDMTFPQLRTFLMGNFGEDCLEEIYKDVVYRLKRTQ